MMKRVINYIIFFITIAFIILFFPALTKAQYNQIECVGCMFSRNNCLEFYSVPPVCYGNPPECCRTVDPLCYTRYDQWYINCYPEMCQVGYNCYNLNTPDLCQAGGGEPRPCSNGSGRPEDVGNCCIQGLAPSPTNTPPPYGCPGPDPYCDNNTRPCSNPYQPFCDPNIPPNLVPAPAGCSGVCTQAPQCQNGYLCITLNTPDLCNAQSGISQPCQKGTGGIGNCCVPNSIPQGCQSQCPPAAHPQYLYGQCFTTDQPDNPTPTLFECSNTQTDCINEWGNAYADCYCCLNAGASPAPIYEPLNPLCGTNGISTAIGCIPVGDQNEFLAFVLRWALGIAGGIAFILIIYGGFLYMTSSGDKQRVNAARELLTAAIGGLMLLIFSVFLLNLLGVRILQIPGL